MVDAPLDFDQIDVRERSYFHISTYFGPRIKNDLPHPRLPGIPTRRERTV
jgi:hypothetical protein